MSELADRLEEIASGEDRNRSKILRQAAAALRSQREVRCGICDELIPDAVEIIRCGKCAKVPVSKL